jgi:hypothetical protein
MSSLPSRTVLIPLVFAALLLFGTWRYYIPLMLWDHLDLVPLYEAWRQGGMTAPELWRVHDGSHFHTAAYVVLLMTTHVSGGQPLLDCITSWALLFAQACVLLCMGAKTLPGFREHFGWQLAFAFLALYPGHLANLQWGWQVAVFISTLFGAVLPVYLLTGASLSVRGSVVGTALAVLGVMGFSTALAMFPVAIALVASRGEISVRRRTVMALPWLIALLGLVIWLGRAAPSVADQEFEVTAIAIYALNYLGSGVLRFAEDVAPIWAIFGAVTGAIAVWIARGAQAAHPWLALMLFSAGCAVLTALGRVGPFGVEHAFVTRYVSFSSLFWLGWLGLVIVAVKLRPRAAGWWRWALGVTLLFTVANAVHLTKQAVILHKRSVSYARHLVNQYPRYDQAVLDSAFGDRSHVARERLEVLRERGFAPFQRTSESK